MCVCVLTSSSYKDARPVETRAPPQRLHFYFNHCLKGPAQIQSHREVLGQDPNTWLFWGDKLAPDKGKVVLARCYRDSKARDTEGQGLGSGFLDAEPEAKAGVHMIY